MERHSAVIDPGRCIGCGRCARVCVAHNIAIHEKKAETKSDDCIMCGQSSAACPVQAISISGYPDGQRERDKEICLKPEDVLEVIRFRRSIRRFQQREMSEEVVGRILEAGRLTHTAKNMQDVSFVALHREKDRVEQMAVRLFQRIKPLADLFRPMARSSRIDDRFFFWGAPIAIVILARDKTNGILAAQNMEFVAEAHGLGVLFSGFFTTTANASRKIRKVIGTPKGKSAAMTLVLGYPEVKFLRSAPRRELDVKYL